MKGNEKVSIANNNFIFNGGIYATLSLLDKEEI